MNQRGDKGQRHTPGPWQAFNGYLVRKCVGDVCAPIAHIDAPYRHGIGIVKGEREVRANIHLIAAAPELLAACESAERSLRNGGTFPINGQTWQLLANAIKKARGA